MTIETQAAHRPPRVAVIGGGYVGLPLAVEIANCDMPVTIIDIDKERVHEINDGRSPIVDVTDDALRDTVNTKPLSATDHFEAAAECDVILICVPTPLRKSGDPDVSFIEAATQKLKPFFRRGQLIILESTTYPGYTREVLAHQVAEAVDGMIGQQAFVAFSPERVDPGNKDGWTVDTTPKVVGGITPTCTEMARVFYQRFIDTVHTVSSAETAEMTKLLENTFRGVNIALANEMSIMCRKLGINTREVINAAKTKPFGFMPFYPGPGVGGHCIKPDPHYLSWRLRNLGYRARFIDLADAINDSMPGQVVDLITQALNRQERSVKYSRVHVLGVSYKPNVSDTRESPAQTVMQLLRERGATLSYEDPHVPEYEVDGKLYYSCDKERQGANVLVVLTDHYEFYLERRKIPDGARAIVDTRDLFRGVKPDCPIYTL